MPTIMIQGMTCGHCVSHVKQTLEAIQGVTSVQVDLQKGIAQVEGSADVNALLDALTNEGYPGTLRN